MAQKKILKMEEERQESVMKISSEARTTLFVHNDPTFLKLVRKGGFDVPWRTRKIDFEFIKIKQQ